MKVYIFYMALCSFTQGVYISRMSPISRMTTINRVRSPTAFRPGISLQSIQTMQRPWNYGSMHLTPAASHRPPYVMYRSSPQRYAIKHYGPSTTRNLFTQIPWKTTVRLPPMSSVTPEYEFMKAASAQPVMQSDGGTGAIHTIPAPNLSLSEKPIVVIESSEKPVSGQSQPTYEVTEKYPEGEFSIAKIEPPVGFSKATSYSSPELQTLIRHGAALQLASELSLPAINQNEGIIPQQFQMQNIASIPSQRDTILNNGVGGIIIPPNALYQSDPMFLQKLQNQLLQRFSAVEFIPYAAEAPNQIHLPPQPQVSQHHPQIILLDNEQLNVTPLNIHVPEQNQQKNVFQRDTQETSVVTLIPHSFVVPNATETQAEATTTQQPQNITVELVAAESQPVTTTIKYVIETSTERNNTTPIYYAQVGESVGSVVTNGFYSAINEVKAAADVTQVDDNPGITSAKPNQDITTTTPIANLKTYLLQSEGESANDTTEIKPMLGVPFKKATDAVNVAYTLVRADDKQPKISQEGTVYAGQIVEATISDDHDFNKEKATFMSRRAPIRLFAVEDSKNIPSETKPVSVPKVTIIKAKISPDTKLAFDNKTGEPILRIYASYLDNNSQKDALPKVTTSKPIKENIIKRDLAANWRGATRKSINKSKGVDVNQVTQFGLKLRERSDDYIPLFEDYDD